ncbi:bifunctional zinc-containing alcohol dehydrogenase/quinone oxidoreductase [Klebsiella pneumoniae]|uniref:Bifunctional zinc-containing alcohol dehydrogenase/quinone oxidoreductase n=1 Tax=Klebsiella pneumoniae TaxID=573 RepID=A0A2X3EG86_KLEPN|nr:bifunctional zinc-containing alcohol dehydrogenase/quinone oxidoreductase [Klebsiella pneumoniae]
MPVLQAGEVLVQVYAVGVNPPDSYLRDGYQQLPPEWRPEVRFPLILGTDLSGVVVARADDVREVAVGDEVYAMARFPEGAAGGSRAYAEYVSVPVSDLARKPLNPEPSAGCRGADVAPDRLAVHDRSRA